jgi:surface carbohydrate biosynthesis protein
MGNIHGIAYFSCEVGRREVMTRAYLAGGLAARGIVSIICHKTFFTRYADILPKGVFHYKSVTKVCAHHYSRARSRGHITFGVCEELLNHHSGNEFFNETEQIHPDTLKALDWFVASNQYDADVADRLGANNVLPLGNLRLDYAKNAASFVYEEITKKIKSVSKRTVLLLSPGGALFAVRNLTSELEHYNKLGHSDHPLQLLSNWITRDLSVIDELRQAKIDSKSDYIIVRPHPHDDPRLYGEIFRDAAIHVTGDYEFYPWALAADEVIHFDSTVFVELQAMGQLAIRNLSRRENRFLVNEAYVERVGVKGFREFFFFDDQMFSRHLNVFCEWIPKVKIMEVNKYIKFFNSLAENEAATLGKDWAKPERFEPSMLARWAIGGGGVTDLMSRAAQAGSARVGSTANARVVPVGPLAYAVFPEL